jgi:hypothetical protein
LAVTLGGRLLGLVLNYGAITLLDSLVESGSRRESDREIRTILAWRVGLDWRGMCTLLGGFLLSAWVAIVALW